jgi:hypothetical protein
MRIQIRFVICRNCREKNFKEIELMYEKRYRTATSKIIF